MKGLLVKDFSLFMKQKKSFLMVIGMFVLFPFMGMLNSTFVMAYLPFVFCIYVMSSLSYDEFDNGFPFLLVLPVTRQTYVREKYLFGLCLAVIGVFLSGILGSVQEINASGMEHFIEWLPEGIFTIGVILLGLGLYIGIMIPIQLKFGTEKGRVILFGVFMMSFAISYLIGKSAVKFQVDFGKLDEFLEQGGSFLMLPFLLAAAGIVLLISYGISVRIMMRKEF